MKEAAAVPTNTGRRRVPRRSFESPVGVLLKGEYVVERAFQVGEGGMMISSAQPIPVGTLVVCSFFLRAEFVVIVRGVVRSVVPPQDNTGAERYGVEFENLHFQYKREIRNFVAASTRQEGKLSF